VESFIVSNIHVVAVEAAVMVVELLENAFAGKRDPRFPRETISVSPEAV
jgi:hypothetical protein